MKSFWISITIFTAMIIMIVLNYFYISRTTNRLCDILQSLPEPTDPECNKQIAELEKYWENHYRIIKISTASTEITNISNEIIKLKCLAMEYETSDFEVTRHQLLNAIRNIKKSEKLLIENII